MSSADDRDHQQVVEYLARPSSHPEGTASVSVVETHISWVFLTDRFAYKLKKPVQFDFLDFSTVEARHWACQEELRLNRRLASHVYLDALPIARSTDGGLQLGGEGTIVDWVVKMRRLPADRALDQLIKSGQVDIADIDLVGDLLASFYRTATPEKIEPDSYRQTIENHVRANRVELLDEAHRLSAVLVKRVHAAQLRLLVLSPELLDKRVKQGRIVEGHGDLRPEHIYLESPPVVMDCIEFNREFRVLDVADELCFLTMECDYLNAHAIGRRVMEICNRACGDHPLGRLNNFYQAYRACVRAKVASLRSVQLDQQGRSDALQQAARYLDLADSYMATERPPWLLVVRGLAGTGKSTLAAGLADLLGVELLQTDVIRREMFGASQQPAGYGEGNYRQQQREKVYGQMLAQAAVLLSEGLPVVLDGTFLSTRSRQAALELAAQHGSPLAIIRCDCLEEIAIARIERRLKAGSGLSEARPELFEQQKQEEEPDPPSIHSLNVDTTPGPELVLASMIEQLRQLEASAARAESGV